MRLSPPLVPAAPGTAPTSAVAMSEDATRETIALEPFAFETRHVSTHHSDKKRGVALDIRKARCTRLRLCPCGAPFGSVFYQNLRRVAAGVACAQPEHVHSENALEGGTLPRTLPRTLQELAPVGARLCLEVRRFLAAQGVQTTTRVVVGFSGGADSTALALVLRCLGFALCLAHLDHGLRPESADEARAAVGFAERLGVACHVRRVDVGELARVQRCGLEEAGRQARYAFLEDVRQTCCADWIATGHHLDDLSEDVLLRLVRGTGWPGLGGMAAVDRKRHLVRPVLLVRRERLVALLQERGVDWVEDASNQSEAFRRNRLRKNVIPQLQAENPAFPQAVRTLWELAREDEAYWQALLAPVYAQIVLKDTQADALFLPRAAFSTLPRAARLRVYMGLIRRFGTGQAQAETLFRLDQACIRSRCCKVFQLPGGVSLQSDSAGVTVYPTERSLR